MLNPCFHYSVATYDCQTKQPTCVESSLNPRFYSQTNNVENGRNEVGEEHRVFVDSALANNLALGIDNYGDANG